MKRGCATEISMADSIKEKVYFFKIVSLTKLLKWYLKSFASFDRMQLFFYVSLIFCHALCKGCLFMY